MKFSLEQRCSSSQSIVQIPICVGRRLQKTILSVMLEVIPGYVCGVALMRTSVTQIQVQLQFVPLERPAFFAFLERSSTILISQ